MKSSFVEAGIRFLGEELSCFLLHPLLLWDLNAKSLVPLQFLPTIQSFHSQPSHLMDLPWNLSSLASFSFTYLIPRHLSYPSYRDFLFQTKPFGVQKHPGVSQSVQ